MRPKFNRSPRSLKVEAALVELRDKLSDTAWKMDQYEVASYKVGQGNELAGIQFYHTRQAALEIARDMIRWMVAMPQYNGIVDPKVILYRLREQLHPSNTFGVGSVLLYEACQQMLTKEYIGTVWDRYHDVVGQEVDKQ